jgi:hypothetical protein
VVSRGRDGQARSIGDGLRRQLIIEERKDDREMFADATVIN